jgi:hypothetical protein
LGYADTESLLQLGTLKPVLSVLVLPPLALLVTAGEAGLTLIAKSRGGWMLLTISLVLTVGHCGFRHQLRLVVARSAPCSSHRLLRINSLAPRFRPLLFWAAGCCNAPDYGTATTQTAAVEELWHFRIVIEAAIAFRAWAGAPGHRSVETDVAQRVQPKYGVGLRWLEGQVRTRD